MVILDFSINKQQIRFEVTVGRCNLDETLFSALRTASFKTLVK